ncbi:MAG: hypothetical protein GX096_07940 [Clostridiales bacterium]|nr:hypothetical protein [Clostridiales bacterium]
MFEKKLAEIKDMQRMAEELAQMISSAQQEIKDHMTQQGLETLVAGTYKATYKSVTSRSIDSKRLKEFAPELAELCSKARTTRRFTIA